MTRVLSVRNRQRARRLDPILLRRVGRWVLEEGCGVREYEVGIRLVGAFAMARLNQQFLKHAGSTDVITFDHAGEAETKVLCGEIVICLDDAVRHAARFKTTWQSEVTRYLIHGVLHLLGHDDQRPRARRAMKEVEGRLLRGVGRRFAIAGLDCSKPGGR